MPAKKGSKAAGPVWVEAPDVTATDGSTQRGLCTVPLEGLLHLLENRTAEAEDAKGRKGIAHVVRSVRISASTKTDCVHAEIAFQLQVMDLAQPPLHLLPSSVVVTSAVAKSTPDWQDLDEASFGEVGGFVTATQSGVHVYRPQNTGNHSVSINALIPYATKNKSSWTLQSLPPASDTSIKFTVTGRDDVQVIIDPCLEVVRDTEAEPSGNTIVEAFASPTSTISCRWTQQELEAEAVAQKPVSMTVDNNHLMTVGEGLLTTETEVVYDIRNGSVSSIEIAIDANLRVLHVDGPQLRRWDVTSVEGVVADVDDGIRPAPHNNILKIVLEAPVEGHYALTIRGELSLKSTSCQFDVPVFKHVQECVTREKGSMGFEARTNVELEQAAAPLGCVPIDIEELAGSTRSRASNPLLLAYKYLYPKYTLKLQVQKHGDVDVLIATVDSAHCIATKTEQGRIIYNLTMKIRNTQKQYVRIDVPNNCDIWSTVLSGQAVKPARDEDTGAIMVPLEKHSGGDSAAFVVELVWVQDVQQTAEGLGQAKPGDAGDDAGAGPQDGGMGKNGTVKFAFPKIDLPVNIFLASVFVPDGFRYGEFEGDLKEVTRFSESPPTRNARGAVPRVPQVKYHTERRARNFNRAASLESFESLDEEDAVCQMVSQVPQAQVVTNMMLDTNPTYAFGEAAQSSVLKSKKKGIMPVQVNMVTAGSSFKFERLLVVDQELRVEVEYEKKTQRARRKLHSGWCCWSS
eukprot:m.481984 g.481984  ORF g.481984 m.481984 type:complete len:743 (+) comp22399_c0_seq1:104-2332(+)